jgi:hypothetical protein
MLIVLKILAAWTAISAATSLAIAPALARRIRDANFPQGMDGSRTSEPNGHDPGP